MWVTCISGSGSHSGVISVPQGTFGRCLETFVIVMTWEVLTGIQWVKTRDVAKHPRVWQPPQQIIIQPQMSIALRSKNPELRAGSNVPKHSYHVEKGHMGQEIGWDSTIVISTTLNLFSSSLRRDTIVPLYKCECWEWEKFTPYFLRFQWWWGRSAVWVSVFYVSHFLWFQKMVFQWCHQPYNYMCLV